MHDVFPVMSPARRERSAAKAPSAAPVVIGRAALAAVAASLTLSACTTVEWVRTRFVEPRSTPAPAPAAPSAAAHESAQATPPRSDSPSPPVSQRGLAAAPVTAPATPAAVVPAPAPVPKPAAAPPTPAATVAPVTPVTPVAPVAPAPELPAAQPRDTPPATAPAAVAPPARPAPRTAAPLTAPVPPKATADMAPGSFGVQVGVFMVATSAEAMRSRTATQLQAAGMAESDAVRVVRKDNRNFVVVGDYANPVQAEELAAKLRATLRRDVVIFRR